MPRTAKDLLGNAVYYCMAIHPCLLQDTSCKHVKFLKLTSFFYPQFFIIKQFQNPLLLKNKAFIFFFLNSILNAFKCIFCNKIFIVYYFPEKLGIYCSEWILG